MLGCIGIGTWAGWDYSESIGESMETRSVDGVDSRTGRKDYFGISLFHGFPDFDPQLTTSIRLATFKAVFIFPTVRLLSRSIPAFALGDLHILQIPLSNLPFKYPPL